MSVLETNRDLFVFRDLHEDSRAELNVMHAALAHIRSYKPERHPAITLLSGSASHGLSPLDMVHVLHPLPTTATKSFTIDTVEVTFFDSWNSAQRKVQIELDPANETYLDEEDNFGGKAAELLHAPVRTRRPTVTIATLNSRYDLDKVKARLDEHLMPELKFAPVRAFPEELQKLPPDVLARLGIIESPDR